MEPKLEFTSGLDWVVDQYGRMCFKEEPPEIELIVIQPVGDFYFSDNVMEGRVYRNNRILIVGPLNNGIICPLNSHI